MASETLTVGLARSQAEVLFESYQRWNVSDGVPSAVFYRQAGGYLVRFPDVADFEIRAADARVHCVPVPDAGDRWQAIYQQQIVPLTESLRGVPVYHGAAVEVGGVAVAFLGASGQGKSTLTAALASRGHPFLADDCLRLQQAAGNFSVLPDLPSIRLWDDSVEALAPIDAEAAYPAGSPKGHLLASDALPHARAASRLARVYVLGEADVDAPCFVPLTPADAAMAWTRNAFVLDIKSADALRRNFELAAALGRHVPAARLDYPRRYEVLDAVVEAVVAELRTG